MSDVKNLWDGAGLPPVGSVVAFNSSHGFSDIGPAKHWIDGDELEVVAHRFAHVCDVAVVWNRNRKFACGLVKEGLRPIKSDAEQFVEKVKESFEYIAGESRHALIERLARFIYENEIKGR